VSKLYIKPQNMSTKSVRRLYSRCKFNPAEVRRNAVSTAVALAYDLIRDGHQTPAAEPPLIFIVKATELSRTCGMLQCHDVVSSHDREPHLLGPNS
jgi:hypothetical protein